jgi:hypothetical protein
MAYQEVTTTGYGTRVGNLVAHRHRYCMAVLSSVAGHLFAGVGRLPDLGICLQGQG